MLEERRNGPGAFFAFHLPLCILHFALCISFSAAQAQSIPDEFKVKRQESFEFAAKPAVRTQGDRTEISFATTAACDATVAIEDGAGRIVRHLASGCLGPNAPVPFRKDSLAQTIAWDGKDDQGRYVRDRARLAVRVSLGLRPRFERTLFWSPKKRLTALAPQLAATEEGVYVYDGDVVDHLRLFDHQGRYVRTIYPFPAGRLKDVVGLRMHEFPQDGARLPLKEGFFQATLLTSGPNAGPQHADGHPGKAAQAMDVRAGRIALVDLALNRLATDGASGIPLPGPKTSITMKPEGFREPIEVRPLCVALDPTGRWLYLTAYTWKKPVSYLAEFYTLPVVMRMELAGDKPPELFLGSLKLAEAGKDDAHFNVSASVTVDEAGRVYVADFLNDRVQVFSPRGELLKSIRTAKPVQVCLHHKTQQIYVFSWAIPNYQTTELKVAATLTRFGPFDDPKQLDRFDLPVPYYEDRITTWYGGSHRGYGWGQPVRVALDSWTEPETIWLARENVGRGRDSGFAWVTWEGMGIRRLALEGGKLVEVGHFGEDAAREVVRVTPAVFHRQRLYVNPADGMLYVAEGRGYCKSVVQLVRIDPATGGISLVDVPFSAEDFAFDTEGLIYLRTNDKLARYDPVTWREVPFDYGEEWEKVGYTADGLGLKTAAVVSAVGMPAPAGWHHGGLYVAPKGDIVVSCYNKAPAPNRAEGQKVFEAGGYVPAIYPGRARMGEVHVWNPHGQWVRQDAVKGLGILNGVGLDASGSIYVLASRNRVLGDKPYFNPMAGTLIKFRPDGGRVISTKGSPVALEQSAQPARPPDVVNGPHGAGWVEGAEWMYGGVGFGGKNPGTGCACWNCRFALDYFGRSFAPEVDHYRVAVLDGAGNLICRVGRYGNVDDGAPLVKDRARDLVHSSDQAQPQSIGGDEVALFHACYVATHTDHRLFIADAGNARIVSVKLDYHASETIPLK